MDWADIRQAYLKASDSGEDDQFGYSVAVAGDTVVVGAPFEDSGATGVNGSEGDNSVTDSGAVYVFTRNGTTWTQQAYLKASNTGADDRFGFSVAIDGDTVVVGAIWEDSAATGIDDDEGSNSGAAYVFTRSGTTWTQQTYLKASNASSNDEFGFAVAVADDTVVVGAHYESSGGTDSGAAYVFTRSGTIWSQQAYLKASNTGANDEFGCAVAISADTVVVGALLEDSGGTDSGAAYVFTRSGTTWSQQAYLKASNTDADDQFGFTVAISADTVVAGAPLEDSEATGINGNQGGNSATYSGAAYVFTRSGTTWTQQAYLKASNTEMDDQFGYDVAVSGDTVVVGAPGEDSAATGMNGSEGDNSVADAGAAYVFTRGGTSWSQQAYLKGSTTRANDNFGLAVAVAGANVVAGAPFDDNLATDSGAACTYDLTPPYTLTIIPPANGAIGGAGQYQPGSTAEVTATPDPGYLFTGWSGDASGTTNPLGVLMDANKSIGATFEPDMSDTDGDGLSHYAEIVVHGTDPAKMDTDDDGWGDGAEVEFKGDPTNASRLPVIELHLAMPPATGNAVLRFPGAPGGVYAIRGSDDLDDWQVIESGISGTGNVMERVIPMAGHPTRFFKVNTN